MSEELALSIWIDVCVLLQSLIERSGPGENSELLKRLQLLKIHMNSVKHQFLTQSPTKIHCSISHWFIPQKRVRLVWMSMNFNSSHKSHLEPLWHDSAPCGNECRAGTTSTRSTKYREIYVVTKLSVAFQWREETKSVWTIAHRGVMWVHLHERVNHWTIWRAVTSVSLICGMKRLKNLWKY